MPTSVVLEKVIAPVPRVIVRLSVSVVVTEVSETAPLAVAPPPEASLVLNTTVSAGEPLPIVIAELATTTMPSLPVVETFSLIVTPVPDAVRLRRRLSRKPAIGAPNSPTNRTLPSPAVVVSE